MEGVQSKETHFRYAPCLHILNFESNSYTRVVITSEEFGKKPQPARHRMVYSLLKDEMAKEGGIHALQLRTKTPEEEAKQAAPAS